MSAFMVSRLHISCLLNWYDHHANSGRNPLMDDGRITLANRLSRENALSVNYCYPNHPAELPHVWDESNIGETYRAPMLSPVQMLKAIRCLDYQSCEHPTWEKSEACRVLREMECCAIARLDGYEEAPWEICEPADVTTPHKQMRAAFAQDVRL